ncbi:MAG: arylesterase [Rhizobiaceae bacterium]
MTVLLTGALAAAQAPLAAAETLRVVAFGDSLMAGYQLAPPEGFAPRLEAALRAAGYDVDVVNAGVSGDTTTGGRARLDWAIADGADLVILELGANDALRGIGPEITEGNLKAMITSLKARNIPVLLAGMLAPPNMGAEYEAAFNAIFPRLAEAHDLPLYGFFLDGVAAQPDLLLTDGMHPNPRGVERIVAGILPQVTAILDRLSR